MFPILFAVGPFTFYTLAPFICLAIFAGFYIVWKRARELHFEEKEVFDVVLISLLWMFISARLGYVLTHLTDFSFRIWDWFNVFGRPGWYFPAGLLGGGIAAHWQARLRKWDPFQLLDMMVTGLVLSQAFLAIGAWLSGIGYGLPTTSFIGMKFVGVYDKRYPLQLLELVGYLGCFVYLWWAEGVYRTFSWYRRGKSQVLSGFLVGVYLIWTGVLSVVVALLKTPVLVWGPIRFDLVVPVVGGILGGLAIILSRSGITPHHFWFKTLDYFGLSKHPKRIV